MYKRSFSAVYVVNVVFQSIFTLLFDTGVCVLIAYLLNSYAGVGRWIFVPFVLFGLALGIFSMVKLILSAMRSLERLEESQGDKSKKEDAPRAHDL